MRRLTVLAALAVLLAATYAFTSESVRAVGPAVAAPDLISFRLTGSPTQLGADIKPLYTVPAGQCLILRRYALDAEKQGTAMPRGGDFTVSVSLWLPGQTDPDSIGLAEATTLDSTRANIEQGNFDALTLPPGTAIKAVVYINLNTGPLTDYFYAVYVAAEKVACA